MAKIMNDPEAAGPPQRPRSYCVSYRVGGTMDVPPCPGCSRTNWLVGRTTAECAFCGMALPL